MDKPEQIKKVIEDKEIITDKKIIENDIDIARLILRTKDMEYIKECINNKELGLSESSKNALQMMSGNENYINLETDSIGEKRMKLPENMTVGMEIESVGSSSSLIIEGFSYKDWKSKYEADLIYVGCEVISPVMLSTEEYTQQIYIINNLLRKLGQSISKKCGGHIHIGADFLKSTQAYYNFRDIYCATEKILYVVCNEKGTIPRPGILENAVMLSDDIKRIIGDKSIGIVDETDLDKFVKIWQQSQSILAGKKKAYDARSMGLNVLNVFNINNLKNTIEFRFPNGTLEPEMWIDNINLLGGIVAVSQEIAEIQEKGATTQGEKHKLDIFERLKKNKSAKEKLQLLLEIIGLEPQEYIDRYNTNIELIKKDVVMSLIFAEEINEVNAMIEMDNIKKVARESSVIQQQKAEQEIVKSFEKSEKINNINIDR